MAGLINIQGLSELKAQEDAHAVKSEPTPVITNLAHLVRNTYWPEAKRAKQDTEQRILRNLRMYKGEYEPAKLAAIREMKGSEAYMPIVNIKCRAGEAWVKDVMFQPNEIPWDLRATPKPELPPEAQARLQEKMVMVFNHITTVVSQNLMAQGQVPTPDLEMQLKTIITEKMEDLKDEEIEKIAKEASEEVKEVVHDQLTEGNFYEALEQIGRDIFIFPSVILKGPIYRKEKFLSLESGSPVVEERIVKKYERRNPLNIYPAPYSTTVDDGYLIDLITLTQKGLSELRGIEGYIDEEIDLALDDYASGGLKEWTNIDTERNIVENKTNISNSEVDTIDIIEFHGDIRGKLLKEYEMDGIEDDNKFYPVCVWIVGTHVIKCMMNYDPIGKKPFNKASLIPLTDSFWGMALPDVIGDLAQECNAINRSMANNAALSSGPMMERNIDRVPSLTQKTLYPYMMFDSTEISIGSNSPAIRFYQPLLTADRLFTVLSSLMKVIDEVSGIPAYAHGDTTVGGAGRTASGLASLTSNANRGIKAAIRNIDIGIIEPAIRQHYYISILDGDIKGDIPDVKIVARGSIALMEKEVQSVRRNEFLTATTNPFDLQILGQNGRKYLLKEIAKANGIDVDKLFEENEVGEIMDQLLQSPPMPPQIGNETMNPQAGNAAGANNAPVPANVGPNGEAPNGLDTASEFVGDNGR